MVHRHVCYFPFLLSKVVRCVTRDGTVRVGNFLNLLKLYMTRRSSGFQIQVSCQTQIFMETFRGLATSDPVPVLRPARKSGPCKPGHSSVTLCSGAFYCFGHSCITSKALTPVPRLHWEGYLLMCDQGNNNEIRDDGGGSYFRT